ncbi:hypothetical protein LUZ60_003603 [Juncus effusus]|nr:hypothetical protein LUZ60_003603 [Juncus effusus]
MGQDLVEIQPRELQFPFELKKQSTCTINLVNKSNDYVAFKVKTTSPKKYCVRPNTGVILPMSSCGFTVTMQAQKAAPPDMQLKDKFLVQTTAVPFGTTEEDIIPDFFAKDSGRYIEESKLRVVLISPPNSPEHYTANHHDGSVINPNPKPVYLPDEEELEQEQEDQERPSLKESFFKNEYSSSSPRKESSPVLFKKEYSSSSPLQESSPFKKEYSGSSPLKESTPVLFKKEYSNQSPIRESLPVLFKKEYSNSSPVKESSVALVGESQNQNQASPVVVRESPIENLQFSHVTEDVENLKSKVNNLESKLEEAEKMIVRLRDESKSTVQERDTLQNEMVFLRKKTGSKNQVGFPFLFVVYMVLVGMAFGYFLHA